MVAVRAADYYGRRQPRRPRRLDARDARRDAPLTMIPLLAPMHARIRAIPSSPSPAVSGRVQPVDWKERARKDQDDEGFRTRRAGIGRSRRWFRGISVPPSRFA